MSGYPEKQDYRPDVDGLRAVAVLSVIVFHVDKTLVPGGFVGVDVFFVISGFLISLHILQELEAGRFSLLEFYRRRVKRIAPAMLTVVFVTVTAAQTLLIPEDAKQVAGAALWSVLSLANVYFWRHLDMSYFATASSEIPLLHLWSLGVEEQFYIAWPLLLMAVAGRSRTRSLVVAIAALAAASFAVAQWSFGQYPAFAYYMLPTRAGELLLGALAALARLRGVDRSLSPRTAQFLAITGWALIAGSLAFITEECVFPGLLAVPPTAGAALLILAGHHRQNIVSKWLAARPMVWIGAVSYSAYLWHWPLLAFYRYGHAQVGFAAGTFIVLLTFLLARLTYRYIEQPARRSTAKASQVFLRQYAIPSGAIVLLALAAIRLDGYGPRWPSKDYRAQLAALQGQTRPAYQFDYVCQRERVRDADTRNPRCVVGVDVDDEPHVILWGDSNAAHYIGVIGAIAREAGFRYRNIEISACPPLFSDSTPFVLPKRRTDCRDSIVPIHNAVIAADIVMISAAWSDYQTRSSTFLPDFFKTTTTLVNAGKQVILIGKAPLFEGYDRRCPEKALSYPFLACPPLTLPLTAPVAEVNSALKDYADRTPNVAYFDLIPYLCEDGKCTSTAQDGQPLYFDKSHLSLAGSWRIGEAIVKRDGVPHPFHHVVAWIDDPTDNPRSSRTASAANSAKGL